MPDIAPATRAPILALAVLAVVLPGCGGDSKGSGTDTRRPSLGKKADEAEAAQGLGFPAFATKNTTRVGGADPVADAAGTALAVFPSVDRDTRPRAVVVVDRNDWASAVSAAQLMSRPLRAPILFSDGDELPAASGDALDRLNPTGASQAGRAQVIRVGATTAEPEGWKSTTIEGADPAAIAAAVDKVQLSAAGRPTGPGSVLVASLEDPAYAMPAANWAAKSGDPVLWTERDSLPAATRKAISDRGRPRIYVLGPESVVGERVLERLKGLGEAQRISGPDPVSNAIAFARFSDGRFGWNVVDPGHGFVFASTQRPLDAPASAPLSASGTFGPLLLVEEATALPSALSSYLLDVQPGYDRDPVRAVYNHGWVMGDPAAISIEAQARIDALLEVQPVRATPSG